MICELAPAGVLGRQLEVEQSAVGAGEPEAGLVTCAAYGGEVVAEWIE